MPVALLRVCLAAPIHEPKFLKHSYRDGDVAVEAWSDEGYAVTSLKIKNRRDEDIIVDVNGSYLEPEVSSVQRIGLGLIREGVRDTTLKLRAGGTIEVKILSVCMDPRRASPGKGQRLLLAQSLAPPVTREVLANWKRNPRKHQSNIQTAVWKNVRRQRRSKIPAKI